MQMNNFFSRPRLIVIGAFSAIFTGIIMISFGKLAFSPKP